MCYFAVDTGTCTLDDPKSRIDCGYPGIEPDVCVSKGCCFNNEVWGVPWCFNPDEVKRVDFRHGRGDITGPCHFALIFSNIFNYFAVKGFHRILSKRPNR